jgi:hypothetical protein
MKPLVALVGGAVTVAMAVGGASLASAMPNQDNGILCSIPAYAKAPAHFTDCEGVGTIIGDVGHDTSSGLTQTWMPLAMPTMSTPTPPTPQNLCAAPSAKPC